MARLSRLLRLESSSGESLDSAVCTSGCHSLRTSSSLSPAHRTARSKLMGDQTRSAGRATQKGQETPRRCRAGKTLAEPDAASQAAKQSPNNPPTRDPGTSRGTHTHTQQELTVLRQLVADVVLVPPRERAHEPLLLRHMPSAWAVSGGTGNAAARAAQSARVLLQHPTCRGGEGIAVVGANSARHPRRTGTAAHETPASLVPFPPHCECRHRLATPPYH